MARKTKSRRGDTLYRLQVVGSYFYHYYGRKSIHYSDYISGYLLLYGKTVSVESLTRYLRMYSDPTQNDRGVQIWMRDPKRQGYFILLDVLPLEVVRQELRNRGALKYGEEVLLIKTALFNLDLDALFVFSMISKGYLVSSKHIATEDYIKTNLEKLEKLGLVKIVGDKVILSEDGKRLRDLLPLLIHYFSKFSRKHFHKRIND